MINVERCWTVYRDSVVPSTACQNQVEQTKTAFYAGGLGVFEIIKQITDSPLRNPTELEKQAKQATKLYKELTKFFEDLE